MTVAVRIAPVAPSGWPRAIAPPRRIHDLAVEPQLLDDRQSLRGERFVELDPADVVLRKSRELERFFGIALIGPMPMMSGGTPATA